MLTVAIAVPADLEELVAAHQRAFAEDIVRYGFGPAGYDDPDWHRTIGEQHH